jgi:hypothetical protein
MSLDLSSSIGGDLDETVFTSSVTSGFLERYFDAELKMPRPASVEVFDAREIDRLVNAAALVFAAGSLSRRLGGEASSADLAIDKKRSKRVGHALRQSILAWTVLKTPIRITDAHRQKGAQLDWQQFYIEHIAQINTELVLLATWAIRNGEHRWGRSAVVALENELRWMRYAMRD